jgi:RNA polymerase sigma factor (sigma-70 family)
MTSGSSRSEAQARFERLYLQHHRSIYSYIGRRVAPEGTEVADLVADVFSIAWRREGDIPPPPEDRLWLFGVARRRLLEHHRQRQSRSRLLTRLAAQPALEARSSSVDQVHVALRAALERLSQLDREILLLVVWDGLSHAEVASVFGCSVNAIASRLKRARAQLRIALESSGVPHSGNSLPTPASLKETS